MKKVLLLLCLILGALILFGCGDSLDKNNEYKLTVVDDFGYLMKPLDEYYEVGEEVKVYVAFLSGPSVGIKINGELIEETKYEDGCQIITFTMPNKDTVLYTTFNGRIKDCGDGNHTLNNKPVYLPGGENELYLQCQVCSEKINFGELSNKDFVSFADNYKDNIYKSIYELDGEKYGRIISSSDSLEDAVRVCTRHFTDNRYPGFINTVVECDVIYESEILYGVYVQWEVQGYLYEENVISFKKDIADITVRNVVYDDVESYHITTSQEEQIEQIVRYLYYSENFLNSVIHCDMLCEDDECILTIYFYNVCYGDWGVSDEYRLFKQTVVVDKTDGNVNFGEPVVLKKYYKQPDKVS